MDGLFRDGGCLGEAMFSSAILEELELAEGLRRSMDPEYQVAPARSPGWQHEAIGALDWQPEAGRPLCCRPEEVGSLEWQPEGIGSMTWQAEAAAVPVASRLPDDSFFGSLTGNCFLNRGVGPNMVMGRSQWIRTSDGQFKQRTLEVRTDAQGQVVAQSAEERVGASGTEHAVGQQVHCDAMSGVFARQALEYNFTGGDVEAPYDAEIFRSTPSSCSVLSPPRGLQDLLQASLAAMPQRSPVPQPLLSPWPLEPASSAYSLQPSILPLQPRFGHQLTLAGTTVEQESVPTIQASQSPTSLDDRPCQYSMPVLALRSENCAPQTGFSTDQTDIYLASPQIAPVIAASRPQQTEDIAPPHGAATLQGDIARPRLTVGASQFPLGGNNVGMFTLPAHLCMAPTPPQGVPTGGVFFPQSPLLARSALRSSRCPPQEETVNPAVQSVQRQHVRRVSLAMPVNPAIQAQPAVPLLQAQYRAAPSSPARSSPAMKVSLASAQPILPRSQATEQLVVQMASAQAQCAFLRAQASSAVCRELLQHSLPQVMHRRRCSLLF